MSCTRKQIVAQAQSWIGRKESDGSHKEIIDIYNSHTPRARGYKLKYTDAWCAGYVSACAIVCNGTDIIPTEVSCTKMIELFKKLGCWVEDDNYIPAPGDFIFYDWQDSGKGNNTGNPDHVGIVEKVVDGAITVIEGNYSNACKRRELAVGGKYIRGYGVPKYAQEENTAPDPGTTGKEETKTEEAATVEITLQVLKKGMKGEQVKTLQRLLKAKGYDLGSYGPDRNGVDGSFGGKTDKVVRAYQKNNGLTVDGIVGKATWSSLLGT